MNALTAIFMKEHAALNLLFKEYSNERSIQRKIILMKDIQRQLFAHFKEEETYYFKYEDNIKEIVLTLNRLKSEHELLTALIKKENPDIDNFIRFLMVHEHIEENTIYPELEKHIKQEDIDELLKQLLKLN